MIENRTGWHRLSDGGAVWKSDQQCQVDELRSQLAAAKAEIERLAKQLAAKDEALRQMFEVYLPYDFGLAAINARKEQVK